MRPFRLDLKRSQVSGRLLLFVIIGEDCPFSLTKMFPIETHLPVQHFAKAGVLGKIDLDFLGLCGGPWSVLVLLLERLFLEIQFRNILPFLDPENF
jgi:hypothetical protein